MKKPSLQKSIKSMIFKPLIRLFFNRAFIFILLSVSVIAMFAMIAFETSWYCFKPDDFLYISRTSAYGFNDYMAYFYDHINGRWSGNILAYFFYSVLGLRAHFYWIIILLQVVLFAIGTAFFIKNAIQTFFTQEIKGSTSFLYGLYFTAIFYWFYFDARAEFWYWESAAIVYLYSLICVLLQYALVLHQQLKNKFRVYFVICLIGLINGGLSETFSVFCIVLSSGLAIKYKFKPHLVTMNLIIVFSNLVSLVYLALSPGAEERIACLPEPSITEGLKNTGLTVLEWAGDLKYYLPRAGALLLLVLFAFMMSKQLKTTSTIPGISKTLLLLLAMAILPTIILPVYFTSRVCPGRALSLATALFLLVLGYLFVRKSIGKDI